MPCAGSVFVRIRSSLPALLVTVLFTCSAALAEEQSSAAQSATESTALEINKPLKREVAGRGKDRFVITLSEGRLANVVVERNAPSLTLRLMNGQNAVEIEADSEAGKQQDVVAFVAEKAGAFALEVEPTYPKAEAIQYQIRLTDVSSASENDRVLYEARRQYSLALQAYRKGEYAQAQASAERALEIRERFLGARHPDVAAALNVLGVICFARGNYQRAEGLFQRALNIEETAFGKDSLAAADVADHWARNYSILANYTDAERLARQALAIREKNLGSDHFLVATSLQTLGEIFWLKGEYGKAHEFADRALEVAGKSYAREDLPCTDMVSLLGRTDMDLGNFPAAEALFTQNLRVRETSTGADSLVTAKARHDLGLFYLIKIDNLNSERLDLLALPMIQKYLGPDHLEVGSILHELGLVYYRRGDYSTAESYYERALATKEKALGPDHPQLGPTLNNLGLSYWRQLEYPKATDYFRRALGVMEKVYGPDSIQVSYPLTNLGVMAKETGDYASAELYYQRVLEVKEKVLGPNHPDVGLIIESLGILYRDKGDYARAEPLFLRAIAITEAARGPDHPDIARHLRNLIQLYESSGDFAKALRSQQRLVRLEEQNLPLNLAVGSERQKLAFFDPYIGSMERIISFQSQQDPEDAQARDLAATALLERKGRVLDAMADNMNALWNRSSVEDRAVLTQFKDVTSQLANLVLNGRQKLNAKDHEQRIKALTEQREQLENQVARRSNGYYDRTEALSLAAVQSVMPADTALIEIGVYRPFDPKRSFESHKQWGDPRYIAYVILHQGEIRWKDLGPAKEIDSGVNAFRDALRDPERRDIKELARRLDEKIMRPVRALTENATHLLVSPDGQLDLIPFEALVDEHNRYLVEHFSISYLTSGRDLLRMQVSRASKSGPVVIADPSFGEPQTLVARADQPEAVPRASVRRRRSVTTGQDLSEVYFAPLSGTAQEARAIQSLFPEARVLSGPAATKTALKEINAPSILHIATHGFFLQDSAAASSSDPQKEQAGQTRAIRANVHIENPLLRSGLALSGANLNKSGSDDGILTALEAANLNLWGTKLVTLSACETGVGEVKNGEGVYGLRRSFFLAGAETLVMSLWPVSDRVTREMMTMYYTGLKHGLGRGEALRQAELAMLKRRDRQHPFYWASFIQSGEWANLDGKR